VNLAALSLAALLVAIAISCFSRLNVGLLSIVLALVIGVGLGGMKVQAVVAGFPSNLFLTLTGVTLLFSAARVNGSLDQVSRRLVRVARGSPGLIPILFFALTLAVSTIGAGNIAATALVAPVAMTVAAETGISPFLMSIMVANGASAGAFSPVAPTGVIANSLMARVGLEGVEWRNYWNTLAAQSLVAFAGYFLLGGARLFAARNRRSAAAPAGAAPFTLTQKLTLGVIAAFFLAVVVLKADLMLASFAAAVLLILLRAADEDAAIYSMPWNTILMVSGVTMLIAILEKTGGMELFTALLAKLSTRTSVTAVVAFVTGVISVYSSSSGVVLPAFLPTIPSLVQRLGGGDPLAIAYSVNVGAHLVDVSPLSTLGALCMASVARADARNALFAPMLAWGLSMTVVGAAVCFLCFGLL